MQSYSSKNEYFIIDIGTKLGEKNVTGYVNPISKELEESKYDKFMPFRAKLSQPMFPLSISIDYFIPILHQDQLLKTIEKCGEFN